MTETKTSPFRKLPPLTAAGITYRLYESPTTGLRGMLMETAEPLCSLHVAIATESDTHDWTHKDDGLPHTLEHAIFMGSELYPFKGILDKLANRCLARGTNAWTATDHTCYTMTSAGHEGCLNLLPIYADHILYPTLTDECFLTEVHHVSGEGEDKGVVYCEMQARENTSGSLVDRAVLSLLYPHGGYSAETGGAMANLHSLTNAQVARYHREAYRPDNMLFILSGTAGEEDFLSAFEQVEARVLAKGFKREGRPRPWSGAVAPMCAPPREEDLTEHTVHYRGVPLAPRGVLTAQGSAGVPKAVPFPSEDESTGVVSLAWRGPAYADQQAWAMLRLLWSYLTDSAVAPLNKDMVEIDAPYCSRIGPADELFSEGYHQVWFRDVARAKLGDIHTTFFHSVAAAVDGFDLARMRVVVRRARRKRLEQLERAPTSTLVRHVIEHFLYAPRADPTAGGAAGSGGDEVELAALAAQVDFLPLLEKLEALGREEWVALLRAYVLEPPCASVIGVPSAKLAAQIPLDVKARQEATRLELGEAGLQALAASFDAAVAKNETAIPAPFLTAVPIPSYENVRGVPLLSLRGAASLAVAPASGAGLDAEVQQAVVAHLAASQAALDAPSRGLLSSFWQEWAHIESQFVSVAVAIDTTPLTPEQRLQLPLLMATAFKLPCAADGAAAALSKDDFVAALQADTVRYACDTGCIRGGSSQLLTFFVQVELDGGSGLEVALKWLRRALYLTQLTPELLGIAVKRELSQIPAAVRSGSGVMSALSWLTNYTDADNDLNGHALRQQPFLLELEAQLSTSEGGAAAVATLTALRTLLLQPQRMNVFVAGDLTKLSAPHNALAAALRPPSGAPPAAPAAARAVPAPAAAPAAAGPISGVEQYLLLSGREAQVVVASLSAIETHFLTASAPGLAPYSPDHAALLVAIELLTALEGDFWVKLRGAGLTYSYSIRVSLDSRRVSFNLFKCGDMLGAYAAAKDIITGYASGRSQMSEVDLDGAKSTVAYGIIAGTSTRLGAAALAWEGCYEGKGVDYGKWLLAELRTVGVADALHALKKYIVPLFDASANVALTCPSNKLDAAAEGLEAALGVPVRKLQEEQLYAAFSLAGAAASDAASCVPVSAPVKKGAFGGAFDFAKQFKCECPKCIVPPAPEA